DFIVQIEKLRNAFSSAIPGAMAFLASFAFIKWDLLVFFEIETGLLRQRVVELDRHSTAKTDHSNKPLRQHTVQRSQEVVGIDSHRGKSSDHIEYVVCVHRRQDQVAG